MEEKTIFFNNPKNDNNLELDADHLVSFSQDSIFVAANKSSEF